MGRHAAKAPSRLDLRGHNRSTGAVADLHLVLHNRRLLIRCLAALAVPFVVFFVAISLASRMMDWALLIFAPMVLAGVLVGWQLERAHARLASNSD